MANSSYDLGLLHGNTWRQWADASGLVYYQNLVTQVTTYQLPAGWEDIAGDLWARDQTKAWPHWNNQRTSCMLNRSQPSTSRHLPCRPPCRSPNLASAKDAAVPRALV